MELTPTSESLKSSQTASALLEEIDFSDLLKRLLAYKYWIIATMGVFLLGAAIFLLNQLPTYKPSALIQVEADNSMPGLGGFGGATSIGGMMGNSGPNPTSVQMTLIKTNYILNPVVSALSLEISVAPKRFPFIGNFIAQHYHGSTPAPARLGLTSYAWGGESIKVASFNPPLTNYLKEYTLIAGPYPQFELRNPQGQMVLTGRVGTLAISHDGATNLLVSQLNARPGSSFVLKRLYSLDVVNDLSEALQLEELGPDNAGRSGSTGIVRISLSSNNPNQAALILDTIAQLASADSAQQKALKFQKTISFIDQELPVVNKDLTAAQNAVNQYQSSAGMVSLTLQSKILLAQITKVDQAIMQQTLSKSILLQNNTSKSPLVQNVNTEILSLTNQRNQLEQQLARLPAQEQVAVTLMRNVQMKMKFYISLQGAREQALLNQAGTLSEIRILDPAEIPDQPNPLHALIALLAALLGGLIVGSFGVFFYTQFKGGVSDPYWAEKELGLRTFAILPFSPIQAKNKKSFDDGTLKTLPILAQTAPEDVCVESFKSLRTSLLFAMKEQKQNVISIGGITPGTGKSFISLNLAVVFADIGKRVLLVDADMRRGYLNQYFNVSRTPGLSELLTEVYALETVVRQTSIPGLDFISTGLLPDRPSEILLHYNFEALVAVLSAQYDIVIFDAPPILAVTDASLIARACGLNLLVIGGQLKSSEITTAVRRFYTDGAHLSGTIFNFAKKLDEQVSSHTYHNYTKAYQKRT
jgi:tyrosine-protein kinase Etk/Wzc